jgi:hypothetical protein
MAYVETGARLPSLILRSKVLLFILIWDLSAQCSWDHPISLPDTSKPWIYARIVAWK